MNLSIAIYAFVLFAILAVVIGVNLIDTTSRIRKDIDHSNMTMLANMSRLSERALREIDRTSLTLIDMPDIRRILLENRKTGYPRAQSMENFKAITTNVTSTHELLAHLATYSEASDYVYTLGYYLPLEAFPDQGWYPFYDDPEFQSGWIGTRRTKWMQYGTYETYDENLITLLRLYPLTAASGQQRGAVLLYVRESDFAKMLYANVSEGATLLVFDDQGRILLGDENFPLGSALPEGFNLPALSQAAQAGEGLQMQIQNETMRAYLTQSSYTGWSYAMIVRESVAFRPLEDVRVVLSWMAAILLLIGALSLALMKHWVYSPLQRFMGSIHKALHLQPAAAQDRALSFEAIASMFSDIVTDRERMRNQLSVSLPVIRKQLMVDILMGYAESYAAVQPQLDYLDVALLPGNYVVLLLEPKPDASETIAINRAMLHALVEILEQHIVRECVGFAVNLDNGLIAGVLSFEKDQPAANLQRAADVAQTLVQAIRTELRATVVVGIGAFHGPFEEIKASYAEALEALKCISFSDPTHAVLSYAQSRRVNLGTEYALSGHVDSIVRALRECNEAAMLRAMGTLAEAVEKAGLPFRTVHSLYRMVQLQAGAVVLESGIEPDSNFHAQTLAIRQMLEDASTLRALDQAIGRLLPYCLSLLQQKREEPSPGKSQMEAIREYLEAHHADPLLSQTSIAQAFGLSPSYISRLFRQSTGENYTEALATIRVERAKALLSEPGANVNLVAAQVGFVSTHTFIRTFKKLTGVTPGRWGKASGEPSKADEP